MKLPPLNALRCFEAAARLLSLKLAASELCVTPSAVSQQIARLEETLNVPLFIRTPRRLQLTAVGEIYLRAVQPRRGSGAADSAGRHAQSLLVLRCLTEPDC